MAKLNHTYSKELLERIHKESFANAGSIAGLNEPKTCGCFYCQNIFSSDMLTEDNMTTERDGRKTLLCPDCGIDSVIVESAEYEVRSDLLKAMHDIYFS